MGREWAYLAMTKNSEGFKLTMCTGIYNREEDGTVEIESIPMNKGTCYLNVIVDDNTVCSFYYSLDGKDYTSIGEKFKAVKGMWIGAKVGLFNVNPNIVESKGYSDFDWFRFE